jgi:hypothetical protein
MSTTPQMSQLGQHQGQQFPSTSPYQQQFGQQQPFGPQQGFGQQQQQPFGQQQPYGMSGSLEQLQQLGQQQPFQQLLQQLGQQQGQQQGFGQQQGQQQVDQQQQVEQQTQQQLQQAAQAAVQQIAQHVSQQVSAQVLQAAVANGYIDIVQPLPGQPQAIILRFAPTNVLRVLFNPNPQTHDMVQEAFAFGQQVIGIWDSATPQILRSIQVRRI